MTVYIYQLVDPRDEKPFYVGQSVSPEKRFKSHVDTRKQVLKSNVGLTPTQQRLCAIIDAGLHPSMVVIEECKNTRDARTREEYWRSTLSEEHQLTNVVRVVGKLGVPNPQNDEGAMSYFHKQGLFTTAEASQMMNVTAGRIRQLLKSGELQSTRLGSVHLIHLETIQRYIEKQTATTTDAR